MKNHTQPVKDIFSCALTQIPTGNLIYLISLLHHQGCGGKQGVTEVEKHLLWAIEGSPSPRAQQHSQDPRAVIVGDGRKNLQGKGGMERALTPQRGKKKCGEK